MQSKPIPALEAEETVIQSPAPGLTELMASFEVLDTKADKRSTVMHRTQTSSSSGANKVPGSPDTKDQKKTLPVIAR